MTKDEFIAAGRRIYGKVGWQRQLATALEKSPATINRYARGGLEIPVTIELAMKGLEVTK